MLRVGKVFLVGEKGMTGSISSRDEKPREGGSGPQEFPLCHSERRRRFARLASGIHRVGEAGDGLRIKNQEELADNWGTSVVICRHYCQETGATDNYG